MALKLKPFCNEKLQFPGLTNMQILALAVEASKQLKWDVVEISPESILLNVPMDMWHNGEEITFTIEEGSNRIISVQSQCLTMQFVDYGRNRKNISRLREIMEELQDFTTSEILDQKADELEKEFTRAPTMEEQVQLKKRSSLSSYFIPRKSYIATPILMYINMLVFLLMAMSGADIMQPTGIPLLKWGADYGPLTLTGDWWRTLTCGFVHIGFIHLLMNMLIFIFIGSSVEHIINTRRLFISYLLTGLCSSVLSLYIHPDTLSAGASGSIFGLFGVLLAFLLFHRVDRGLQKGALLRIALSFIGYNLLLGMTDQQIDNAAHIGGLLSGFLLGIIYAVGAKFENRDAQNTVSIVGELGVFSIFLFSFLGLCKNAPPEYEDIRFVWLNSPKELLHNPQEDDSTMSDSKTNVHLSSSETTNTYAPMTNNDTWLSYYDATTDFEFRYPSNWSKISNSEGLFVESEFPLIQLANGDNRLTVTITECGTQKEFNEIKEMRLFTSENIKEESSEEAQVSNISINYLPMTKITNVLHTKGDNGTVKDGLKTVLYHFRTDKKRIFTITAIVYDMEADDELQRILSCVLIAK